MIELEFWPQGLDKPKPMSQAKQTDAYVTDGFRIGNNEYAIIVPPKPEEKNTILDLKPQIRPSIAEETQSKATPLANEIASSLHNYGKYDIRNISNTDKFSSSDQ